MHTSLPLKGYLKRLQKDTLVSSTASHNSSKLLNNHISTTFQIESWYVNWQERERERESTDILRPGCRSLPYASWKRVDILAFFKAPVLFVSKITRLVSLPGSKDL